MGQVVPKRHLSLRIRPVGFSRDITERKRREQELTRYETIVETSPIGITIVGSDGEMQFANDRAEEIFGRSRSRINALSFDDPRWDEVDEDGEPLSRELPFRGSWSPENHCSIRSAACYVRTGNASGSPSTGHRSTTIVEIEASCSVSKTSLNKGNNNTLSKSERRYRTLAENFPNRIVTQFDGLRYTLAEGRHSTISLNRRMTSKVITSTRYGPTM